MEKIRVDNGIKKIEVNDKGEYIQFSINDNKFIEGLGELVQYVDSEIEKANKEIEKENIYEKVKKKNAICREACKRLDTIFGENACKKVFGDIEPDEYMIGDFLDQVLELATKFQKERKSSIEEKYSTNRKGANS